MREIKFRQWISRYERMHYDIGIVKEGHWAGPPNVTFSENPLMQFTGLKDKNGKEIYEGDILQDNIMYMQPQKWEVVYHGHGFMVRGGKPYGLYIDKLDYPHNFEVIGNIYENEKDE